MNRKIRQVDQRKSSRRGFLKKSAIGVAAGTVAGRFDLVQIAHAEGAKPDSKRTFRAGAFAMDVTPVVFPVILNGGMRSRITSHVTDPLYARCLVLDDGTTQIAVAIVDSCFMPRSLLDKAKELAQQATGIPAERMLISATHTHYAPSVGELLGCERDDAYTKWLPGRIAEGIKSAYKNLAPARIGWAMGKDPTNAYCRRYLMKPGTAKTCPFTGKSNDLAQMNPGWGNPNIVKPTGPRDTDVPVLSVQTLDGQPIALLSNYSNHYAGSRHVSADYFGVFAKRIKELLGAENVTPSFVGMTSQGNSGDANCRDYRKPRRRPHNPFTVGNDIAAAAYEASKKIKYYDWVPLVMEEKLLTLNVRMPSDEGVVEAKEFLTTMKGKETRHETEVYAKETIVLSQMPSTRELKLQAIRLGELGITAIPNEVFGITGLTIKRTSPLPLTFNICLANGYEGYIPPPAQHKLGGYTTWRARSSCLEIEAEPKIMAGVLELLDKVAQTRRDEQLVASKRERRRSL